MNKPTHALIICVDSIDLGLDKSPYVQLFANKADAEYCAVALLIRRGLYEHLSNGVYRNVRSGSPNDVFPNKEAVIDDFYMNELDGPEQFRVEEITYPQEEKTMVGGQDEVAQQIAADEAASAAASREEVSRCCDAATVLGKRCKELEGKLATANSKLGQAMMEARDELLRESQERLLNEKVKSAKLAELVALITQSIGEHAARSACRDAAGE